jgi:CubicO group peptidase (beta-lactamase class C family)
MTDVPATMDRMRTTGTGVAWLPTFETFASDLLAGQQLPGVAIAVAAGGEIEYEGGFGFRDAEAGLPVTPDTVFGIASIAKPFTALAVLQLAERGLLSVSDPVQQWLPAFRLEGEAASYGETITIHHLLSHTSGLAPEAVLPYARAADMLADPDLDRLGLSERTRSKLEQIVRGGLAVGRFAGLLARLAEVEQPLVCPPGTHFSYSGEGYALLAAIVEGVTGQRFPAYVHEHLLQPLGLTSTGFHSTTFRSVADTLPMAQFYINSWIAVATAAALPGEQAQTLLASPAWWASGEIYGHANMVSTVRDLVRFGTFLATKASKGRSAGQPGHPVVLPATVAAMLAPQAALPTGGWYGYGVFVRPDFHGIPGVTFVEHSGGGKGAAGLLAFVVETQTCAAALTNAGSGGRLARRLVMGAINASLGVPPDAPAQSFPESQEPSRSPAYKVSTEQLARFVGTYRWNDTDGEIAITLTNGTLELHMGGQCYPARPFAADRILVSGPEFPLCLLLDDDDRPWALFDGARICRKTRCVEPSLVAQASHRRR